MPVLVMKFGGTSVASLDKIKSAAEHVASEVSAGHSVIVIVSAMAGKTNELVGWVNETSPLYDAREYDAIVSSGENVTAGLMALTLQEMDIPARSWQGWQVPVITTSAHSAARIEEIQTENITSKFNEGMRVAVVAGFQGVSDTDRTTTLGRGGSDTTAVAFAAAFDAIRCDIYTDVDGIYTTDPRITEKAKKLNKISFEEMLELASLGRKFCKRDLLNWQCALMSNCVFFQVLIHQKLVQEHSYVVRRKLWSQMLFQALHIQEMRQK